jgi:hypothetical protein
MKLPGRAALGRALVASFVGAALALQLAAQTLGAAQLWPFVPYEMYSWAHAPGERFAQRELRAVPDPDDPLGRRLWADDLNMSAFSFMQLLGEVDGVLGEVRQERARRVLGQLIATRVGSEYRAAQIWRSAWQLGESGALLSREPERELVLQWSLRPGADAPQPGGGER